MLKNYLLVAIRSLRKNKIHTGVNVVGLAVGMASCVLIFMLVFHEWSFDRFHSNADSIYRTVLAYQRPDGERNYQAMMTPQFTESFRGSFSSIERATPYVVGQNDLMVGEDTHRQRLGEVHTDFFSIFSFPLLGGDVATVLDDPTSMVVTSAMAQKFFDLTPGNVADAVGETVSITRNGTTYDFSVSGVVQNFPNNSSHSFDVAISFENYSTIELGGNNWGGRVSTYVQLREGTDVGGLSESLAAFASTEFASYVSDMQGAANMIAGEDAYELVLQPLVQMHVTPDIFAPYETTLHNPMYSYVLSSIGLLILLIACINFMTLSIGQSSKRAREVGMRKAMGAYRSQLMKQYWGESLVMTVISLFIGIGLSILVLPAFNSVTGNDLSFGSLSPSVVVLAVAGLAVVVGLVAGGYPAVVLSRFQPAAVLKGDISAPGQNWFTRSLVVLQYTISIGLIVSTGIMSQQLTYMFDKDLGYDQDLIVSINAGQISRADADGVLERMRSRLLAYPDINLVSRAGSSFTRGSDRNGWQDAAGIQRSAYNFGVDYDYIDLMGMEIVEGRNFSRDFTTDPTNGILVNEALVREFEIENPIGHQLTRWLTIVTSEPIYILGVVKDYHYQSLRTEVSPAVMNMLPGYYNYMGAILVKISGENLKETLANIEATWNDVVPGTPYSYSFLDEDVANQYQTEQRWRAIVTYASTLAILIACLGLFGLAILSVTRRTREISIRKVLGASATSVASLVAREFAVLVIIASLLASPLAFFAMSSWLENFAFHIEIGAGIFVLASVGALTIALVTIGTQAVRAAQANPVEALRSQ